MALTPCPRCGNPVSDKAPKCPRCGLNLNGQPNNSSPNPSPNPNNKKRHTWIWIVVILVLIVLIASEAIYLYCDNKAQEQEQMRIEAEHRRDSIAAEQARLEAEAREAAEQARRDSIDWVSFTTPDLTLLDLHGHVKSVSLSEDAYELSFLYYFSLKLNINEAGFISNINASRNSKNQITKIKNEVYDMSISWSNNFPISYYGDFSDGAGQNASLTYTDGRLTSISETFHSFRTEGTSNNTLTPIEHDKYGNWIKAKLNKKSKYVGIDYYEGESDTQNSSKSVTIRRTITYYPR